MPVEDEERARLREPVRRRARGEPLAYVLGRREFFDRDFLVDPRVLVPRPETEHLIERAIALSRERDEPFEQVLDLGTGSGCIATTLALELEGARVTAVDVSSGALEVARENARRLAPEAGVQWLEGDLYDPLVSGDRFDLIVSNPPYVLRGDSGLAPEVQEHEPDLALFEAGEGPRFVTRILTGARERLLPGGVILIELGADQAEMALREAGTVWPEATVRVESDLAGIPRVLEVRPAG